MEMEWKCGFEGKVLTKGRRRCSGDEGKGFPLTSRGSFVALTKKGKRAKENSEREQGIGGGERESTGGGGGRRTQSGTAAAYAEEREVRGCLEKPRTFVAGASRWPGEQNPPPSSPPLVDPPEPEPPL